MVFKESSSRISRKDFDQILMCGRAETTDDYKIILSELFWDGAEAHRASNRTEEFLSHLPFTEYSEAYNTMTRHPPDPTWDFKVVMREIRYFASIAKMIMLHVTFWYHPNLKEPASTQDYKDPIYYYLEEPFRKNLPRRSHADADADEDWKSKAIALQRVVIDFTKVNESDLKNHRRVIKSFMAKTLKFNQMPEEYHERFIKRKFWDRLALEIRLKMPEIPFQHPDLLPYNSTGDNIYHTRRRRTIWTTSPAHPEEDSLPILDPAAGEGGLVAPDIVDLIGQEYGSDMLSIEQISDSERRASTSTGHEQASLVSTPTNHLVPGRDDQRQFDEDDETVGAETEYCDTSSSTPASISTSLGKRKTPIRPHLGSYHRGKIFRGELPHTMVTSKTATRPSASDASQTLKNGRRDVDYFREQVRQHSASPSRDLPETSPSTSTSGRTQIPIDPIPPPRRRRMMTNLPDDMFGTPPPGVVASTASRRGSVRSTSQSPALTAPPPPSAVASTVHRRESVHSMSQSPALTAPPAPMFSAAQETAPITPRGTSHAEPPLSKVEQAVQIVLEELIDKLTMKEQVAAINAVRSENTASVFVMLPAKLRKAWLYNKIGK